MLSVRATYDGKSLKFDKRIRITKPKSVIITFLDHVDEEISNDELTKLSEMSGALEFLNEEAEDVYSDKDLKVKYRK